MIDLHFHLLPEIDDGPGDWQEAVELACAASRCGVELVVATPHVSPVYPNRAAGIAQALAELQRHLRSEERAAVEVVGGGEVAASVVAELGEAELQALTLGGSRWVLLEPPTAPGGGFALRSAVSRLRSLGLRCVIAHPERSGTLAREPRLVSELAAAGALFSVTAGSLVGRFGSAARRFALQLAGEGLMHNVASDAHDLDRRPPGIAAELKASGFGHLIGWLAEAVPAAIIADEPIPPRPAGPGPARRRRLLRFRRAG
jgi:protein-tyrosine phosphatase